MKKIPFIISLIMIVACTIQPLQNKSIKIEKISVKVYSSSKTWSVIDHERVSKVQAIFQKIAPVRKEFAHGFVTFLPLDYFIILEDTKGDKYYYELSATHLRSQKATWPITENEYQVLIHALGIKDDT